MKEIVLIIGLLFHAIEDIRTHEISVLPATGLAVFGVVYGKIIQGQDFLWFIKSIIPGTLLALFGLLSGGEVGLGDGLLCVLVGIYLGMWEGARSMFLGMMLAGVVSLVLLMKGKNRREAIAFAPFLLSGVLLVLIGRM